MIVGFMGVEDNGKRRKSNISRFVIVSQFEICERRFDKLIEEKVRNFLHDTASTNGCIEILSGIVFATMTLSTGFSTMTAMSGSSSLSKVFSTSCTDGLSRVEIALVDLFFPLLIISG